MIQAGTWDAYIDKVESTTLTDQTHSTDVLYKPNAAILVLDDFDLPTEDLSLSIEVFEAGTGGTETEIPYTGEWSCVPTLTEFKYITNMGIIATPGVVLNSNGNGNTQGPYLITNAQLEDMRYDPNAAIEDPEPDKNALVLSFTFADQTPVEYSETWDSDPNDVINIPVDVVVSLAINDGT